MSVADAEKWNGRYADSEEGDTSPLPFLAESIDRFTQGEALVLAAGRGRNAVYLAEHGHRVTALDISEVGLAQCSRLAASRNTELTTLCTDLDNHYLGSAKYDLITKFYYYEPSLFAKVKRALKPGGHLIFQTFSQRHAEVGTFGPRNPAYLADLADILPTFDGDTVLHSEEVVISDYEDTEAVCQLIVQVT